MIQVAASKAFLSFLPFLSSRLLWNVFLSFQGCLTNLPLLLKNFLKSLTAMAYSSLLAEQSYAACRTNISPGSIILLRDDSKVVSERIS
ncbi:hypothetical protein Tco_0369406 [Tanacetum coccineum]